MNEEPIVVTNKQNIPRITILILFLLLIIAFVYSVCLYFRDDYINVDWLSISAITGLLLILIISLLFFPNKMDKLKLFGDRLEIIPFVIRKKKLFFSLKLPAGANILTMGGWIIPATFFIGMSIWVIRKSIALRRPIDI